MRESLSISICDGPVPRVAIGSREDVSRCQGSHRGPIKNMDRPPDATIKGVVEDPYTESAIPLTIHSIQSHEIPADSLLPVAEVLKDTSLFLHPAERFFLRRFANRPGLKLEGIERMKIWENLNGADGYKVSPSDWIIPLRSPTLPPAKHTNLVVLGSPGVIIDPAATLRDEQLRGLDIIRGQKRQGLVHQAIFLTHHHYDHIGAACRLAKDLKLPIWAHEITADLLNFEVHRTFADGDALPTPDGSKSGWTALHTPGHAPGHLCLWNAETRQLVAGDMVAGVGTILIDPEDGDMTQYLESLERLANLHPHMIYPAHGPVICEGEAWLRFYINHRLERENKILNAIGEGPTGQDGLLKGAYDDVPQALQALAARSLESHLRKLIKEGRIERDLFGEIRRSSH